MTDLLYDRRGNPLLQADIDAVLTALFKTSPQRASEILTVTEIRRQQREKDRNSVAARDRSVYERIENSLRRDGVLTGNAAEDARRVFERESGVTAAAMVAVDQTREAEDAARDDWLMEERQAKREQRRQNSRDARNRVLERKAAAR